jgi:hypothetical protein
VILNSLFPVILQISLFAVYKTPTPFFDYLPLELGGPVLNTRLIFQLSPLEVGCGPVRNTPLTLQLSPFGVGVLCINPLQTPNHIPRAMYKALISFSNYLPLEWGCSV